MGRPLWRPNLSSRFLAFTWKHAREQVNLKRFILALFLFPLGLYVYTEVVLNSIVIEPFGVPKRYEEAGLTPEVMSRLIADALGGLEQQANSEIGKDKLALSTDLSSVPNIEAPGTRLGLRTVVEATQQILGRDPIYVRGAIVLPITGVTTTSGPKAAGSDVEINVHIVQGRNRGSLVKTQGPADDPHRVAQKTAEAILHQIHPYLLGAYRAQTKDWDGALNIAQEIINVPPKNKRELAKAYLLWGNALGNQGKYAEAIPLFEKEIAIDPKFALAYYNWGVSLTEQGKNGEAIPLFEKATTLDPKLAVAYRNWGDTLDALGKHAEAEEKRRKALALDQSK